jgi:hypothetical protein
MMFSVVPGKFQNAVTAAVIDKLLQPELSFRSGGAFFGFFRVLFIFFGGPREFYFPLSLSLRLFVFLVKL